MLSNAYFVANFRFDTAENEPTKNLQKIANFANFAKVRRARGAAAEAARAETGRPLGPRGDSRREMGAGHRRIKRRRSSALHN